MFFQLKLKFLLRKTSDCAKCNLQIYIIITEHDVISINQREKASILLCSQLPSISRYQEFVKDFNHLQNKGSQKSVCRVVITSGVCVLLTLESYTWTSLFSWMLWSKMSCVKKILLNPSLNTGPKHLKDISIASVSVCMRVSICATQPWALLSLICLCVCIKCR